MKFPHFIAGSHERGQVLLIVILIMVVTLTVGLGVASRSIINTRTSTEQENSQRAFSAAEAGIEQALRTGVTIGSGNQNPAQDLTNNSKISRVDIKSIDGSEFLVHDGSPVEKDNGADIWLIDHNTDNTLNFTSGFQTLSSNATVRIVWGLSPAGCDNAAMEFIVLSNTTAAPVVTRYAYDPCSSRVTTNHLSVPEAGTYVIDQKTLYYRASIPISASSKGFVIRVIPLYQSTPVGVEGLDNTGSPLALPGQGRTISSLGISGDTQRKVTYFQGYPELPSEYFNTLFTTQ